MKKIAGFLLLLLAFARISSAQQTDPQILQSAIDAKTFVFEARQATGMRGRMIQLDPGYTLNVTPEQVVGSLPFFGRSYEGTMGTSDGGLNFELTEYTYTVKPRKKGGWDITIKPSQTQDIQSIYLTIQKTGNTSLRITSNSKEGMSYQGIILE